MSPELQTHFLNLYLMAVSDEEFHEKEVALLYKLAEEKGVQRETIDTLILNPSQASFAVPSTSVEKMEYLYDYAKLILADGIVSDDELKTLQKFCLKFQFREENISVIAELLIEAAKSNIPKEEVLKFVTQNN